MSIPIGDAVLGRTETADLDERPEALAGVDLTTAAGVRDFLALKLGSHHAARRLLRAAEALLTGRRLFGARGGLMEGFAAKCAGSEGDGEEAVELRVLCESLEGICWDWAELECTCPAARQSGACAHTAALLLATLDAADWSAAERPDPSTAEGGA